MLMTILLFIAILGLLVFVHEFGHFICAKRMGVKVEEFGFGFPPRLIGVYRRGRKFRLVLRKTPTVTETIYSLNWVPLGGFVKIKGEDGAVKEEKDSFGYKKVWQRMIILAAGVSMNVVLGMTLLSLGFGLGMPKVLTAADFESGKIRERTIQVVSVVKNSPASRADFRAGDEILSIDGQFLEFSRMQAYLTLKVGEKVVYKLQRDSQILEKEMSPVILPETDKGGVGIGLIEFGVVSYPAHLAVIKGVSETFFFIKEIVFALGSLARSLIFGEGLLIDLSGPVGIAVLTGKAAKLGLIYVLQFAAVLSINLAVINIMPFPALDGGRILFLTIEKLRGRALSQKLENAIHNIGFALLMLLVLLVTYRDIIRFGDKFLNLWKRIIQ